MADEMKDSMVIKVSHQLKEVIEQVAAAAQVSEYAVIETVLSSLIESVSLINEGMSKRELIMQILKKDGELSWLRYRNNELQSDNRYRNNELQSDNEKLLIKLNGCSSMLKICERSINRKVQSSEMTFNGDSGHFSPQEQAKMEKKYLKK
ncbi:MAG: hypothetical protein M1402_01900 [Candidatus Thermoplasmatota archaeon]|nr:hypothetical protein [Candidatus Thermoplasmatota archaeon]